MSSTHRFVLVHADESCLGNQNSTPSRGGGGALIEARVRGEIVRHDLYIHSSDATNNRMALTGAIKTLETLARKGSKLSIVYVSDSQYLVKGMTEWLSGWKARGWKRKGGKIENLELWQSLAAIGTKHSIEWSWVRGHAGHPKNEYADRMAVKAATDQISSGGVIESHFDQWLEEQVAKGNLKEYDPNLDFTDHESRN
ncbi:MAG: ribonuclease HI [Gemmatimonadetes bacterium]|nr:ribonuclease HI [Gemmatimonadota bacterium]